MDDQGIRRARLEDLVTEARHPGTLDLDDLATVDLVRLMNVEDARVPVAIATEVGAIARAIDEVSARMRAGGRLIYIGAGTSGRLGVLDAAECPATFGTPPDQVVAVIAGGHAALTGAVEDAEDDAAAGAAAIGGLGVHERDTVVGISASGRTPYVVGALHEAHRRMALVISLSGARPSASEAVSDIAIATLVGPEVVAGSTRLKAGTAQKQVLNMLSTGVMVRLGKTYGNLMVDVRPSNAKLRERAVRIVGTATGLHERESRLALRAADGEVKVAIVAEIAGVDPQLARACLRQADGVVRVAIDLTRAGEAEPS